MFSLASNYKIFFLYNFLKWYEARMAFRGPKNFRKSEIGIPGVKKFSEIGNRNSEVPKIFGNRNSDPKNVGNRKSEVGNRNSETALLKTLVINYVEMLEKCSINKW
jgi:hypothetical protein